MLDVAGPTASNDEVANHPGGAAADIISSGRAEPAHPFWSAGLARLLGIAVTAALVAAVGFALHYRTEAGRLRHGSPSATGRPASSSLPLMTSLALRLPAEGTIAGTVLIAAAAQPGADRAQFVVSAVIAGGRPHQVYDLTGNDCSAAAPMPDHVWATGRTDAAGAAQLIGPPWTGAAADEYWLALAPSPGNPPPGVHGAFGRGAAAPFPAGQAPCAGSG